MHSRRVLVSGASGFIGRWSVPALIAAGFDVHAVTHSTGRQTPEPLRGSTVHRADLLDPAEIDGLMDRLQPSHLLHFAWIATPGLYWTSPDNARWLAASRHLLRRFRDQGGVRAVMAGTCAEYDWSRVGVCEEMGSPLADDVGPDAGADAGAAGGDGSGGGGSITPYAACKLGMYRSLAEFDCAEGLSTAWGRVFFQYGPDEHPDRLVASVIRNLLAGREAAVTHGRQIRDFLHVADVGRAFAALLASDVTGPVNIGSGIRLTIAELLGEIAGQIGRPDLLRLGARTAAPSEPLLLVPDVTRLRDEVGWRPELALPDGVADTIRWWRESKPSLG
jgi:nucleoside-diphosphate-sugar epimerase